MATITKLHSNLESKGFSQEELDDANVRIVNRAFFGSNTVYGGANDPNKGEWFANKTGFYVFVDTKTNKRVFLTDPEVEKVAKEQGTNGVLSIGQSIVLKRGNTTFTLKIDNKVVSWQVAYKVGDSVKDALSKAFLTSSATLDADGGIVQLASDIREWASANIRGGVLDREWATALSDSLNERGLIMTEKQVVKPTAKGSKWLSTLLIPHFADTYKAE